MKLLSALTAVLLVLFIISLSTVLTLNFRSLYYADIEKFDLEYESGFSREVIVRNYDALIDYLSVFHRGRLILPDLPMSESARIHFADTKNIFVFFEITAMAVAVPAALLSLFLLKRKKRKFLRAAGITALAVPLSVGLAVAINWDGTFELFHELLFANDYWLFDRHTDPIITMLPDEYFLQCAVCICVLIAIMSIICLFSANSVIIKKVPWGNRRDG